MANERENLNHLRSSIPYKKHTPTIDSGFSSKYFMNRHKKKTEQASVNIFYLALQLAASATPILPINSTQQSIDESAILRTLRMNALHVCLKEKKELII